MQKSVPRPSFELLRVAGTTSGAIDLVRAAVELPFPLESAGRVRVPQRVDLIVGGWCIDPNSAEPPAQVLLLVDATWEHHAAVDLSRRDASVHFAKAPPEHIGFQAQLPTRELGPGAHSIRSFALSADGAWYEAARLDFGIVGAPRWELAPAAREATVKIDAVVDLDDHGARGPLAGIIPAGHGALVQGWALDQATGRAPDGICVADESGSRWTTTCDIPRADVQGVAGANTPFLGFEVIVPTAGLRRGDRSLAVWAYDANGRRIGRPGAARFQIAAPIAAFPAFAHERHEEPAAHVMLRCSSRPATLVLEADCTVTIPAADTVGIEGWAYVDEDRAGGQVIIELQPLGVNVPPLRFHALSGFGRTDEPAKLDTPRRADSWFTWAFRAADVAPGRYRFALAVIDEDRCGFARREFGIVVIERMSTGKE